MTSYTTTNRAMGNALLAFIGGAVLWAVFGNRVKERLSHNQTYAEMKDRVMNKVNQLSDMTETRYHQIVDEIGSTYSKTKDISDNELKDVIRDLKFHWARIKDRWNNPPTSKIAGPTDDLSQNYDEGFKA
jgi:hypothetical protein